ncbi:MAG TPA: hypothetical protein VKQ29_12700 [Aliidongia sp.]|nr:hypothetical protein [Aliidongia sp.]
MRPAHLLLAGLIALPGLARADEPAVPAGYAIHASLPLDPAANGIDGALQILEDGRIGPQLRAGMWQQTTDPDLVLAEHDPLRAALAKAPLKSAHLRLVDSGGRQLADQALDVPLAEIDRQQLHEGAPTFLVTADHSLGIGSAGGLETRLMAVEHGQLAPEPLPGRDGLVSALRQAWKLVDDPTPGADGKPGTGKAIEVVACHPNYANPNWSATGEFTVDLVTYRFADGTWHDAVHSAVGYWESEQDWPDAFP